MKSSKFSPSPFEIPNIKNAKVKKNRRKPFYTTLFITIPNHFLLKMNHTASKQFLLFENIWIHIFSILYIDLQLFLQNIHLFKLPFLNKILPPPKHIEEQLTQLITKSILKTFSMLS